MSSYRFCRTDDVPLLVEAYNRCYAVHFPAVPELTVEGLKRGIRELDLWCSSCMVAVEDGEPIGVLLAGKREDENLVYRLGVRPDRRRCAHGSHLLTSLAAKLAILGPPRLVAEVPAAWSGARGLLEGCGFRPERRYFDFEADPSVRATPLPAEIAARITVEELAELGLLGTGIPRCWDRSPRALRARAGSLCGLAIVSDAIEAWVLYRDGNPRRILALDCPRPERRDTLLAMLLGHLRAMDQRAVKISKVCKDEVSLAALERVGFRPTAVHIGYAAEAVSP